MDIGNMHKNLVKFGRAVFELCQRIDRQTDRQTDRTYSSQYFAALLIMLGPPLTALRYVMYFRFVEDVVFSHSGPYGDCCVMCKL